MARYRGSHSVTVDVDVDLSEFDDKDIVEYLTERGYTVFKTEPQKEGVWVQLWEALRYKPDPLPDVRMIVSDMTGRVL